MTQTRAPLQPKTGRDGRVQFFNTIGPKRTLAQFAANDRSERQASLHH
jgi:hypothetical protein